MNDYHHDHHPYLTLKFQHFGQQDQAPKHFAQMHVEGLDICV